MFENVYYTICKEEYLNSNEYEDIQPIEEVISSTAYAKNKIIDEDYSYLTVKQLNLICDYYGISTYIRIAKCKKEDIVNTLVLYEKEDANYAIVAKRKQMWKYLEELKKDAFMKKFIIK